MTLRDLSLSRHARRFKFYVASTMACVKIFAYFVKKIFQSILFVTTLCYYFIVFPSGTEFFGVFGVFHLRSHYGRKLHFYFYSFLPPLVCYAFQSIATFTRVLSFILVFTAYVVWPRSLEIKKIFNK